MNVLLAVLLSQGGVIQANAAPATSAQSATSNAGRSAFDDLGQEFICQGSQGYAASFEGRQTFLWRPQWLLALKNAPESNPNVKQIMDRANRALKVDRLTVIDKVRPISGAGPNDYVSIGPYWWPDPKKSDGLPYFRKDGITNPERSGPEFDNGRLTELARHVRNLSLAYYLTGDENYAQHAGKLLRTWFITPETRMNPNFNFAQAVPGRNQGRPEGIIESSHLSDIVEAVGVLRPSQYALSDAEHDAMRKWYGDFAVWMATSDIGTREMNKTNNHGVFYDYYLAHFALYAGASDIVKTIANDFPSFRLTVQMDKQGRFKDELSRTRSWHYSHYILEGATKLATISECVDVDLWNMNSESGLSLQTAKGFVGKYWQGDTQWPFPDIRLQNGDVKTSKSSSVPKVKLLFAGKNIGPNIEKAANEKLVGLLP